MLWSGRKSRNVGEWACAPYWLFPFEGKIMAAFNWHTSEQNPSSELISVKGTAQQSGSVLLKTCCQPSPHDLLPLVLSGLPWFKATLKTMAEVWGSEWVSTWCRTQRSYLYLPALVSPCAHENNQRLLSSRTGKTSEGKGKSNFNRAQSQAPVWLTPVLPHRTWANLPSDTNRSSASDDIPGMLQVDFQRCHSTSEAQQEMSQGNNNDEKKKHPPIYKMLTHR